MSTSARVRAILGGVMSAYRSDPIYQHRPQALAELDWIARRLDQPIRIALAGTLKAGKSTLVNALVGEDIAPTDATEATRIVTWFRHGPTPKVTANHRGGRRSNVPIGRDAVEGFARRRFDELSLPRFAAWGAAAGLAAVLTGGVVGPLAAWLLSPMAFLSRPARWQAVRKESRQQHPQSFRMGQCPPASPRPALSRDPHRQHLLGQAREAHDT